MIDRSKIVLAQIDAALQEVTNLRAKSRYEDLSDQDASTQHRIASLLGNALLRLAPPSSYHTQHVREASVKFGTQPGYLIPQFVGMLQSLRAEYESGTVDTFAELLHADLFSDFVEMARHLVQEGFKDAGAVIVGSTLESHIRQLCAKHAIPTTDADGRALKAERLNAELAKGPYEKHDQKQVTAWLDLRNNAAHGHYDKYTREQVALMIDGIADFMRRLPA